MNQWEGAGDWVSTEMSRGEATRPKSAVYAYFKNPGKITGGEENLPGSKGAPIPGEAP